jgi:cytochrome P450
MIHGGVTASLAGSDTVDFHEFSKNLLAQLSSNVFLGENDPSQAIKLQKAFRDAVEATMAIVRKPWPGTKYNRGLVGRKTLEEYFASKVEEKRNSDSLCLFANLCNAVDGSGNKFTNQQICDHMIFLMMAAQDTTSSALTSIIFALTECPEWQERLRAEYSEFDSIADIDLTKLKETSWVFREALRMYTPGAIIPRRAKCDFEFEGYKIPAGAVVSIAPIHNHYDPEYWTQPEDFDPLRFSPDRAEDKKHKFLFLPFSGGPAQCIGMHFAELEIKIILFHLLKSFTISRDTSKKVNWIKAPVWHPKNGLNVSFSKL